MSAKITLYSQDELIAEVKKFAKEQNTSVSKLVNGFFESLLEKHETKTDKKASITNSLLGVIKDTKVDEDDYKKHLEEKYQ
jgi:hypothetical protein